MTDHESHVSSEPVDPTWTRSGRLALLVALAAFVGAIFLPLVTLTHKLNLQPPAPTTPLQMILGEGPHPLLTRSKVILCIPGAALGLLSMLLSRRTREVMMASRPLVFVVGILPLAAAMFCVMKFKKLVSYEPSLSMGVALVGLGTIAAIVGAFQFGYGMPHAKPRRRITDPHDDHEDEDDDGP